MRIATVLCALILFFHVSSSGVDNTHDCNDTASPSTPRNESDSKSQEEKIMTPVQITPRVNESDDCTNSTASSIPTTESSSSTQEEETLISITSPFPSSNSEDCTSTASPSILASEATSPSTKDDVASTSQPPHVRAPPPQGNQKPPMNNYSVSSTDESNTEDCTETTSSSITTSGSTQNSKEEEKTTYTQTTSSAKNSSENGSDTSPLSTVPSEGTLSPTKEEETSAHTPTTVTAKPPDCPQGNLMDGYSFFRRNVTLIMTKRTQEVGKGRELVRCETSTFIDDKPAFLQMRRNFSYTNLKGYRNPTPGDPTKGTFDRPEATYIMQYSSKPPGGKKYNYMDSVRFDGDLTHSLLSPHWEHVYTENNCTVVKIYSNNQNINDSPGISISHTRKEHYHCQLWAVEGPLYDIKSSPKSSPKSRVITVSECCLKYYQDTCGTLDMDVYDERCYSSKEIAVSVDV